MEMDVVNCATTQATVYCLQSMIVRFFLPKVMVALASLPVTDFKEFVECNGISRPRPITLKILPIMLLSSAQKISLLCSILYS